LGVLPIADISIALALNMSAGLLGYAEAMPRTLWNTSATSYEMEAKYLMR
jgi:hypothetical protein